MTKKMPIIDFAKIKNIEKVKVDIDAIIKIIQSEFPPLFNTHDLNPEAKNAIRNYFIIRLVTIFENFFKNKVIEIIDNNKLDISTLFSTGEIKIPLSRFDDMRQKEFTKGRIVSSNFNFQNPDDINFIFSNLLELNFFDTVRGLKNSSMEEINSNWQELLEFFHIRNKLVHSLNSMKEMKPDDEYDTMIFKLVFSFIFRSILVIEWAIHIKNGQGPANNPPLFHEIQQGMKEYRENHKKVN